ncbi:uncharacterized protein LOC115100561 [Rhinatrema bivittatum]|uniref:uncharacterized protein LOC115100561 n=1 Tax=Rhinatrema bivittatum TaxID=194408 RepID=UPI00112CEE92|nr:uncharacterized protein LOC115100561 [Rhinatrema bivittatum]
MAEKRPFVQVERDAEGQEEQAGPSSRQAPKKRSRDACFSDSEKELLCRSVCGNYKVLFRSKASPSTKKRIWERIAVNVSSLSVKTQSCQTNPALLAQQTKGHERKGSQNQGIGSQDWWWATMRYHFDPPIEELVLSTLCPKVVDGVGAPYGCDSGPSDDQGVNSVAEVLKERHNLPGHWTSPFLLQQKCLPANQACLSRRLNPKYRSRLSLLRIIPETPGDETTMVPDPLGEAVCSMEGMGTRQPRLIRSALDIEQFEKYKVRLSFVLPMSAKQWMPNNDNLTLCFQISQYPEHF